MSALSDAYLNSNEQLESVCYMAERHTSRAAVRPEEAAIAQFNRITLGFPCD